MPDKDLLHVARNRLRDSAISGVGWVTIEQVSMRGIQFVFSIFLARLLTPDDFGLVGMVVVFSGFAILFVDFGFSNALIQFDTVREKHYSSVFWVNISTGVLITIIFSLISPVVARIYSEPKIIDLFFVIGFSFILNSLGLVPHSIIIRRMEFRSLAFVEIIAVTIAGAVAVLLANLGFGVWSLVSQILLIVSLRSIFFWAIIEWRPKFIIDRLALSDLLNFSVNLMGFNSFNYWARTGDDFLIGKYLGSSSLGIYSRAYSIMQMINSQISGGISRVFFPTFSRIQNDKVLVKCTYLRLLSMISLISFPTMVGLFVISDSFVHTIFGSQWIEMIGVLRIFAFVGLIQSLVTTVGLIYQSQGRTDLMFRWGIFAGTLGLVSFVIGISFGTIEAVALCYAVVNVILLYWNFKIPGNLIDLSFIEIFQAIQGILICAIFMGIAVWAVGLLLQEDSPYWLNLVIQIPSGFIIYSLLIHVFKLEAYTDARGLVWGFVSPRLVDRIFRK